MAARSGTASKALQTSTTTSLDQDLAASGLQRYALKAPSWRAPWLAGGSDMAYPQFFPTCEGQEEDQLTESAVKAGYNNPFRGYVTTETFSPHQLIYEKLTKENTLSALTELATAVAEKAKSRIPSFGPTTFRLPSRVTLTEQKREAWVSDLANPAVPLSKLSKNVPHGYRGEKLLDMIFTRQVMISRAIWYIRAIGAIEIASQKSRAGFSVAQYTYDWSVVVQDFVKKQLAEMVVPDMTPSSTIGSTVRSRSKRVLADSGLRLTWTAKFSYTLKLLAALYEEHLLDRECFLRFIVHQIESSNIAQLPFILFLAEEYLGEFLQSESQSTILVAACFERLTHMPTSATTHQALLETTQALTSLIRSTFIALPDAFVSLPFWPSQTARLEAILMENVNLEPALLDTIKTDLADLNARFEARSEGTFDTESVEPDELETIQILDSIAFPVSISTIHKAIFQKRRRRRSFHAELQILFTWSTTSTRFGSHRPYAISSLTALEIEHLNEIEEKAMDVEKAFIGWIDAGMGCGGSGQSVVEEGLLRRVIKLLEELVQSGVMSYSLYLQRMIARGETEDRPGKPPSVHLQLLRTVAISETSGSTLEKRRIALRKGLSSKADSLKLAHSTEKELRALVPCLLDAFASPQLEQDGAAFMQALHHSFLDGSHFEITRRIIPQGVGNILRALKNSNGPGLSVDSHAILAQTFLATEDFRGLLQYICLILSSRPPRVLLLHILDLVELELDTWTAMGALPDIASGLNIAHEELKAAGVNDRRIIALLRKLGAAGHTSAEIASQFEQEYQTLLVSLSTSRTRGTQGFTGIVELQNLLSETSPQAIGELATTLWYRYHSYENWGGMVLEGAISLLSSVPPSTIALFLQSISERLPTEFGNLLARWISTMAPATMLLTFGGSLASSLQSLFANLVSQGTVSAAELVEGVVLPMWKALLFPVVTSTSSPAHQQALDVVTSLFEHLTTSKVFLDDFASFPNSAALLDQQRVSSRRNTLYTSTVSSALGHCIALLVATQDMWSSSGQGEKVVFATDVFTKIGNSPRFKMVVARDPQILAAALLDVPQLMGTATVPGAVDYRPKLLAALLTMLKDGGVATPASLLSTEEWDLFLSGLTVWRLSISKVEVKACLERLDLDDSLEEKEKEDALQALSRHFLDRVCSGAGHTYLGEQVVQCYHGRASDELVSAAFVRLAEAVDGLASTASPELRASSLTALRCIGRLLNTLLSSGTASARPTSLDQLLKAVKGCLEAMIDSDRVPSREALLHASHLLGLSLSCVPPGTVGNKSWELFKECLIPCAQLAALLSKDRSLDSELAPLLLDTCSHLLFGLSKMAPPTFRLASLQGPLYSSIDIDYLPDSIITRLSCLFGQANSSLIPHPNPWELLEHSDPGLLKESRHNNYPIDLHHFDAKVLEAIPLVSVLNFPSPTPSVSGSGNSERGLQKNFDFEMPCTGLSLAARGHRRTLTASRGFSSKYNPGASLSTGVSSAVEENQTSDGALGNLGAATSAARGTKRKEPEIITIDDSDEEVVVPRGPQPAKRGRGSTGGKAPGRGRDLKKARA